MMGQAKKRKRLGRPVFIGQNDERDDLLEAARKYIEVNGGKPLVIGPIELQQWPEDNKHVYRLAIKFTGKPPSKPT